VDFLAAVDASVDLAVVEDSQHERARDVRVGTLGPARGAAVDHSTVYRHSAVVYRHSQRLNTHDLTCDQTARNSTTTSVELDRNRLEVWNEAWRSSATVGHRTCDQDVAVSVLIGCVATLGKLFTPMCLETVFLTVRSR